MIKNSIWRTWHDSNWLCFHSWVIGGGGGENLHVGPLWQHVCKQFILMIMHNWGTIKHGVHQGSILCSLSFPLPKQSTQNFSVWSPYMYSSDVSKGKGKVPVHAMKAYKGNIYIAPFILNLGTGWRWVVSLMFWPLCYPELETAGPLE